MQRQLLTKLIQEVAEEMAGWEFSVDKSRS
jgi:hypothetical protein